MPAFPAEAMQSMANQAGRDEHIPRFVVFMLQNIRLLFFWVPFAVLLNASGGNWPAQEKELGANNVHQPNGLRDNVEYWRCCAFDCFLHRYADHSANCTAGLCQTVRAHFEVNDRRQHLDDHRLFGIVWMDHEASTLARNSPRVFLAVTAAELKYCFKPIADFRVEKYCAGD